MDKIKSYTNRIGELIEEFGYCDRENKRLIEKAEKELERSYKAFSKSQSNKLKAMETCSDKMI